MPHRFDEIQIEELTLENYKEKLPKSLSLQVETFLPPIGSFDEKIMKRYVQTIKDFELIEKMHEAFREIMREFYRGKDYIASQIKIEEKDRMDEKKRRIELKLDRGAKDRSTVIELMKGIDLERRSKVYYPKVKLKVIAERNSKEEDKYNKFR